MTKQILINQEIGNMIWEISQSNKGYRKTTQIDIDKCYYVGTKSTFPDYYKGFKNKNDFFKVANRGKGIRFNRLARVAIERLIHGYQNEHGYDFDKLEIVLKKLRENLPEQQSIIIESEDSIIYDHIIQAMDRCRACGLINIILSASKS